MKLTLWGVGRLGENGPRQSSCSGGYNEDFDRIQVKKNGKRVT